MRAPRHIKRYLWGALSLAAVGCLWFLFAPAALGGSTSYVVTDGISMEPRFHAGDLALVRSEGDYRVGQIVAYHNRQLGTVVLHRIVARDGSRYVFKGDNNNFTDFEHPARSQLIGALWIHLPGAGSKLASVRSPALIGLLFAAGTLLLGGAAFTRRRRRRRRERAELAEGALAAAAPSPVRDGLASGPAPAIIACALAAMVPFVLLAVLAFTRPSAAVLATPVPYHQTGRLSYAAHPGAGPTYPSGSVRTGEPLFTHVVHTVDLAFAYRFSSRTPHRIAARAALSATVASTSGWRTTIPLSPPSSLHGDSGVVHARLELAPLIALIARVESVTAVRGSYTLTIVPRVTLGGQLAGAPLRGVFAPASKFSLNSLEIRPVAANGAASEAAQAPTSFEHKDAGAVIARRSRPAHIALGPVTMTVAAARAIALGGLALVTAALLIALALVRPRRRGPAEAALARYGSLIVPVERVWQQPGVAVIDVADMDALVRVAAHYERSILHERAEYGDAFWVSDESGQFRYAVVDPAWQAFGAAEEAPAEELAAEEWQQSAHEPAVAAPAAWQHGALEPEPAGRTIWDDGAPGPEPAEAAEPAMWQEGAPEPEPAGWAPAPAGPEDAREEPSDPRDLRPAPPAQTLQFGAVSPSALAHR